MGSRSYRISRPTQALKLFGPDIADIHALSRAECGARAKHAVAARPMRSRGGVAPLPIVPKEWGRLP